jgi:hypothetical protein
MQLPANDGSDGIGYGIEYPVFWIDRFHPHGARQHTALPGLRPTSEGYPPGYYAAFVLDPDGNNMETVSGSARLLVRYLCGGPMTQSTAIHVEDLQG